MTDKKKRHPTRWNWIKHSVTGPDNVTFDSGRLALFFVVFGICTLVILVMLGLTIWDVVHNKHEFHANDLGTAVMGVLTGIGAVLLGVGGYLFGDWKNSQPTGGIPNGFITPQQTTNQPCTEEHQDPDQHCINK